MIKRVSRAAVSTLARALHAYVREIIDDRVLRMRSVVVDDSHRGCVSVAALFRTTPSVTGDGLEKHLSELCSRIHFCYFLVLFLSLSFSLSLSLSLSFVNSFLVTWFLVLAFCYFCLLCFLDLMILITIEKL